MRVKNSVATRKRRKRMIERAEGYWGTRHVTYKVAKQSVIRAGEYAFRDRRVKKRDFRKLWISRINAAVREQGTTYSRFMHSYKLMHGPLNRKMLADLAMNNPNEFDALVKNVLDNMSSHATTHSDPKTLQH